MKRALFVIALAATVVLAEEGHRKKEKGEGKGKHQPSKDIVVVFRTNNVSRAVFSHERHFGALGSKDCAVCHAEGKGLIVTGPRKSVAANPVIEPHGANSRGRFCASCHDGKKIVSALGRTGDPSCAHCHVPEDHGADFTKHHGDMAKHGGEARCEKCHRGSTGISAAELRQANDFFTAQSALAKDPQDKAAFQKTLPNNFCAYCHTRDQKAWKHKGREE